MKEQAAVTVTEIDVHLSKFTLLVSGLAEGRMLSCLTPWHLLASEPLPMERQHQVKEMPFSMRCHHSPQTSRHW